MPYECRRRPSDSSRLCLIECFFFLFRCIEVHENICYYGRSIDGGYVVGTREAEVIEKGVTCLTTRCHLVSTYGRYGDKSK